MRLKITHRTEYQYDAPVPYALQRLRLVPYTSAGQSVVSWSLKVEGAREEVRFVDQFANHTRLISVEGGPHMISVEASGEVDTKDVAGVSGAHRGFAPLWLFQQPTPLTQPGERIAALARDLPQEPDIPRLHSLMALIGERVAYTPGVTDAATTAEDAVGKAQGVCQDHTHIFIAAARLLGFPARYVSGYLMLDDEIKQAATHAWAEAHVESLGWVAFDVSNGISPDERYVSLASGRDYRDAMPVSGIRLGMGEERLAVRITVEQ